KNGGRRVGIVLEEFGRAGPAIAQVESAIVAWLATLPARRDPIPIGMRYAQEFQQAFVATRARDKIAAHAVELGGRRLDISLDLVERETVISAFVPITLALDGVEVETHTLRSLTPIVALAASDALHVNFP